MMSVEGFEPKTNGLKGHCYRVHSSREVEERGK